jgi:hypothetical protein
MERTILIKFLDDPKVERSGWGVERIDTKFDTLPSEFISFAEIDLESSFPHKFINALSNAKRALDCQADRLLKLTGFYQDSQKKFWGLPKKLELIQEFEIIAPRILNKINRQRNLMEHQYVKPDPEQVLDFLDVVSLFIASTEQYINFINKITYVNFGDDPDLENFAEVEIIIDNLNYKILIGTYDNSIEKAIDFEISKNDPFYIEVFKRHLRINREKFFAP